MTEHESHLARRHARWQTMHLIFNLHLLKEPLYVSDMKLSVVPTQSDGGIVGSTDVAHALRDDSGHSLDILTTTFAPDRIYDDRETLT